MRPRCAAGAAGTARGPRYASALARAFPSHAAPVFDTPDDRAGSAWLAREGRARQGEVLVALLSRYNHDVRTPLNTVMSWTHLLQQGKVDSARSQHVADVLARCTREQAAMLDAFVDDGRAVLGALQLDPSDCGSRTWWCTRWSAPSPWRGCATSRSACRCAASSPDRRRRAPPATAAAPAAACRDGRAPDGAVIDVSSHAEAGSVLLRIDGPAAAGDWSDAALLDLRISSFLPTSSPPSCRSTALRARGGRVAVARSALTRAP